jgi:hypothetical protein
MLWQQSPSLVLEAAGAVSAIGLIVFILNRTDLSFEDPPDIRRRGQLRSCSLIARVRTVSRSAPSRVSIRLRKYWLSTFSNTSSGRASD